jgi:pseudouridine-5'-phosphate glycosidase
MTQAAPQPHALDIRPEVAAALRAGEPVVGMTSATIGHSLPWPDNLEVARLAQSAALREGAILAVIAVWKGKLTVGLSNSEIEALAQGASTRRAIRRDLSTLVVRGATAATAVSASICIAHHAGLSLLVTGAIGGVAHGSAGTLDLSSDLMEMSRTPIAVVSAGARSVLDLEQTAEMLEAYSVPVFGYRTESFPFFYERPTNNLASARVESPDEAAALLQTHWGMGGAGAVVAQPTPEEVALSPDELYPAFEDVKKQAAATKIRSRDLPPFLMERLNRLTKGRALRAYRAILEANARLAAQIARSMAVAKQG